MVRLTSELVVKLTDQVSGPAGKMAGALNKATGDLSKLKGYKEQADQLDKLAKAHEAARTKIRGLADALMAADSPSKRMQASYAAATAAADKLGNKMDWQRARVRGAADALSAMGVNARNLAAGEAMLRANIERTSAAIAKQERAAQRAGVRRQAAGTIAGGAAAFAGVKGLQLGKDAIRSAGSIDYALRQQQFATGLSKEQQDSILYPQAKRIGQDTKFSNEDIVRAQTEFANGLPAAIKTAGVIASVIDQAKNYALTIKGVDMQQSAMAVRGYLLSMGKDISTPEKAELEARGATNKMIRATKIGGMTHDDLMPFIARGASAGRIAGLSEETLLALAVGLKRSNISGDQAGTAVRTASSKLVAPTPKGVAGLTAAGIDYDDYTTMSGGGLSVENFAKKFKQDFGKSLTESAREALTDAFSDPDIVGDRGAFAKAVTDAVAPLFTPKADGTMRASDARTVAKKAGDFHKFSVESVDAERLLTDIIKADPTLGVLNAFLTDKHGNKFALLAKSFDQFEADKKDLKSISPTYGDDAAKLIQGGLGGAIERMTGAVETFKTTLGKENEGWLTPVTNKIGEAIDMLTRGVEKSPLFAATAGAIATGAAGIGGAFKLANDLAGGNLPAIALTGSAAALTKSAFALDAAAAKMAMTGPAGDALKKAGPLAAAGITAMGAVSAGALAAGAAIILQDYKPAGAGVTKGSALPGQEHDDGQLRRRSVNELYRQRMDAFKRIHGDGTDSTEGSPFMPKLDLSSLESAKSKTAEVREELTGLNDTTVSPKINSGPMAELLRMAKEIQAVLSAINGSAGSAKSAMSGVTGASAGRGRSDVATATANLSRSRQTNMTDRSYTG